MKLTFEEAVALLPKAGYEIIDYLEGYSIHEELGKAKCLQSEVFSYSEGNIEEERVVLFENCEEPIAIFFLTNSWAEGDYQNCTKFSRVESKMVERWFKTDGRNT